MKLPCIGHADLFQPAAEPPLMSRGQSVRITRPVREAWAAAVELCQGCHRRAECLADELAAMRRGHRTLGVYGGTTPPERMAMLDQTRLAPPRIAGRRPPVTPRARKPISHGTPAGYTAHLARGETACAACKDAHSTHRRRRREEKRSA